jgi:hypothetical protein
MDCLHSMAPDDEELVRLALDEQPLHSGAKEHLEQCAICQQRLAHYKRTNAFLLARLYRSQCPDATGLNHYCAGMLPADEAIGIAYHLQLCPLCANEVAEIRRLLASFEPFPQTESAFALGAAARRIIASLVPWRPQLITRGETPETPELPDTAWPRQYRAEAVNISLHLSRASNGDTMLLGLFSSANPDESVEAFEGIAVELYGVDATLPPVEQDAIFTDMPGSTPFMASRVDDLGNVVFKAVPAGRYTIIVRMPTTEYLITGLTIGTINR